MVIGYPEGTDIEQELAAEPSSSEPVDVDDQIGDDWEVVEEDESLKSVRVDFLAKPTAIFANFVLDFCKLRLGLLSHFDHIELGRNVTCQKGHFALDVLVSRVFLAK